MTFLISLIRVQKVGDVEELYEVLPPLHSCKLRLSRSIGDFYMKWDVCDGPLPDIDCVDTIGSYQTPIIRVTCPADVPPKYVSLKSPPEQAVSCEPVILHQRRILDRYELLNYSLTD